MPLQELIIDRSEPKLQTRITAEIKQKGKRVPIFYLESKN